MPNWYFSKEGLVRTPSRLDGIDYLTETRYRREGTRFIMNCGNKMGLRYDTMATGAVYFHRFYMIQSFKNFPRWVTGAACLFLAGKVEETPKKCRDIIKTARTLLPDPQFEVFGDDPREEVMTYERVLLQTIKFDLQVDHPYQKLLKFGKALKGDREKLNKVVQMAWTFTNDSLSTTLCLRYKPEVIAVAMLALAAKFTNYDLQASATSQGKPWYSSFIKIASGSMVTEITDLMLELYGGGGKRRDREKLESSDQKSNLPSSSSPSVTYSPPVKRKKTGSSSTDGKVQSSAPEVKGETKQAAKPSHPPLPPAVSTQLQVENISPAPTPNQPQVHAQPATPSTEPPKVVQSVDTTFTTSVPTNTGVPQASNVTAQSVAPVASFAYATTPAYITTAQNYGLPSMHQAAVLPASGMTYQGTLEYAQRGVASVQVPVPFQAQSYLPPSQGYGQTAQYPPAQHLAQPATGYSAPLPPLGPTGSTSVYTLPPSTLGTHQTPASFGLPPGHGAPNLSAHPNIPGLPPPPLPPLHGRQPPLPHPGSRDVPSDYQWPRGWMR